MKMKKVKEEQKRQIPRTNPSSFGSEDANSFILY